MRRRLITLATCALLAGCGNGGGTTNKTTSTKTASTVKTSPTASLDQAAHTALEQNAKLSDYVLSHNVVPTWASQSTGGPALAGMRSSAEQRRAGKVRVRVLTSAVEIRSVQLDPSYLSATASVVERSRVRVYQHGRPVGGVRALNEPAQVQLHRIGDKSAFVVWKLAPV
jgi:hypothetical protein